MSAPTATLLSERQLASPKRPAILDAAVGEFLAKGFEGASMDRIAARAGVSKRTIYDHFSSKDGLVRAIAKERLPRPEDFADFDYDPDIPLEPQLRNRLLTVFTQSILAHSHPFERLFNLDQLATFNLDQLAVQLVLDGVGRRIQYVAGFLLVQFLQQT